uniref:Uncharacterized protein n=1 Tax=Amphimedon queenslandica TaxID=400682 RepID=A0A1X7TQK5_AMPQE
MNTSFEPLRIINTYGASGRFQLNKVRLMHQKLMPYLERLVPSLLGMLRKCSLK